MKQSQSGAKHYRWVQRVVSGSCRGQLTGFYAANGLIINLPLSGLCGNRDCFCCPGNTPIRPGHLILSHHGSLSSNVGTELPSYYLPKAKQGVTKKSPLFHKTRCVHQVVVYR